MVCHPLSRLGPPRGFIATHKIALSTGKISSSAARICNESVWEHEMLLLSRDYAKWALQKTGLFPAVRAGYRLLNPKIRHQRFREINFYSALLKPDALCFDIGANLGQKAEVFLCCAAR